LDYISNEIWPILGVDNKVWMEIWFVILNEWDSNLLEKVNGYLVININGLQ
jgi:hypothetical protein